MKSCVLATFPSNILNCACVTSVRSIQNGLSKQSLVVGCSELYRGNGGSAVPIVKQPEGTCAISTPLNDWNSGVHALLDLTPMGLVGEITTRSDAESERAQRNPAQSPESAGLVAKRRAARCPSRDKAAVPPRKTRRLLISLPLSRPSFISKGYDLKILLTHCHSPPAILITPTQEAPTVGGECGPV